ncbi:MAG: efflux RND transporter permease subunit, partial [Clostridiales bacterium]|nr:efflux RND transporter permease subunit [Clostridiales bacterium]MCF8023216.1 efflux RND transporter permease subunit [Clostridiales bacterium]
NNKNKQVPELDNQKNILGKWAGFFTKRFRIVLLVILAIVVWGASSYTKMPRELQPEIILPFGHVVTTYNGAAPEEVENLITDKIESKMDELEKVDEIESTSAFGYSSVLVEFEPGVEIDDKVSDMREKVSNIQSQLPDDADTPMVYKIETNNSPIMVINITGDYDFINLKNYAEDIKEDINKLKEISDVQVIGGLEREIQIFVDPQKLSQYNISMAQIKNAIKGSHVNFPGGDLDMDSKNYNIRTVSELEDINELKNVIISYTDNRPLFLKDIAEIKDGYEDPESFSRLSSGVGVGSDNPTTKRSVALSVKKKESADVIKTSDKIHDLMAGARGEVYPDDLQVEVSGDTAVYVKDQLGDVTRNAQSGLLLVCIVLLIFIGLKESLVVSIVIPMSVFTAFGLMSANGMTFNNLSLFSLILAVGMLVDNGIVIMQNIARIRSLGLPAQQAAETATNQIAPAVGASTLTTLAAFFPILITPGIMGQFIRTIPQTVMFALSASFIVAITITPALCAIALRKYGNGKEINRPLFKKLSNVCSVLFVFTLAMIAFRGETGGIAGFGLLSFIFGTAFAGAMIIKLFKKGNGAQGSYIIDRYGKFLHGVLSSKSKRRLIIAGTLAAFVFSISLIPLGALKIQMFSKTDYTRLYVNIETPRGTCLDDTSAVAAEVERRLLAVPGIKSFVSNIGMTGADSFESFGGGSGGTPNKARVVIDLYEREDREKTSMQIATHLRDVLKDIPGAEIEVTEMQNGPPSGGAVAVELTGENLEDLKLASENIENSLKEIQGTRDISNSMEEGSPELQVKVKKNKAALLGLSDMDIAMGIRNAVHGIEAASFNIDQDEIDIIIRTTREKLESAEDLEKLYFYNRSGVPISFSQVAGVVKTKSFSSIKHQDLKRSVDITAGLDEGFIAADVFKELKEKVSNYSLPESVTVNYGGEMEEIQESYTDMFTNMIIAIILVFFILAVQFNSLSQPFIIMLSLPLAMIGVMPGLVLTGNNFEFVSFIGVVALVGIAVNNSILLLDYINYLRKKGYELIDAVTKTGLTRFLPVMSTTITTSGGILPITIKQPLFGPMGYALIFGLIVSTMLTLVFIPVIYTMLEEFKLKRAMKKNKALSGEVEVDEEDNHPVFSN